MICELRLEWPPRELWPNARPHWSKARALARSQRILAADAARRLGKLTVPSGDLRLWLGFHPPSRRRFDRDNAVAACKAAIDGLTREIGFDDSRFVETTGRNCEQDPDKIGFVLVRISMDRETHG